MGYTLTIGELEVDVSDEYVHLGAEGQSLPKAPSFGEPTDGTNSRWPSYTAWHEFCNEAGIAPLFYGKGWDRSVARYQECPDDFHRERPLLNEHPGAAPIYQADVDYVAAALTAYQAKHPDAAPGFAESETREATVNSTMARLIWLDFWMRWAVENCSRPVLANS